MTVHYDPNDPTVYQKDYAEGQVVVLADKWDNLNGVAGSNYVLAVDPATAP